jgi:predicted RNase H-like HicB family nuclease
MPQFVALISKSPAGGCVLEFPDFSGCVTAADTVDEARILATEALSLHVVGLLEDGHKIPAPSTLDSVIAARPGFNSILLSVWIPDPASKHRRICSFLPYDLLDEIDRSARLRGISRSAFLCEGAQKLLLSE